MKSKYIVLFNDGTSSFVYAGDIDEAIAIAFDKFTKSIVDVWLEE